MVALAIVVCFICKDYFWFGLSPQKVIQLRVCILDVLRIETEEKLSNFFPRQRTRFSAGFVGILIDGWISRGTK